MCIYTYQPLREKSLEVSGSCKDVIPCEAFWHLQNNHRQDYVNKGSQVNVSCETSVQKITKTVDWYHDSNVCEILLRAELFKGRLALIYG